jgi:hypothetical protein
MIPTIPMKHRNQPMKTTTMTPSPSTRPCITPPPLHGLTRLPMESSRGSRSHPRQLHDRMRIGAEELANISSYPRRRRIVTAQHQVPSSSSSTDQGFIISKILTQNTHGLRRLPKDENGNICPNAPHDYTRYEHLITTMKLKQLNVYFVQKTWLEGCDDNLR